jgi:hypothetical protein
LDRILLFVSILLILIGLGGLLIKFTLGCDSTPGAFCILSASARQSMHIVSTQASFHDIEGVSGYMLLFGMLLLPMGLFKDGPPILGPAGKAFTMVMVLIVASLGLALFLIATASGPTVPGQCTSGLKVGTIVTILPGSANNPNAVVTFSPKIVNVTVGTTIEWYNNDSTHTVTSQAGDAVQFDSGIFNKGDTFCWTFNSAGTFPYFCKIHSWMHGTVVVKSA